MYQVRPLLVDDEKRNHPNVIANTTDVEDVEVVVVMFKFPP